ncbi:retrovirus-related Pol polyprotein from transposon 17.6 [Trichonephila clavipes]|nr:retrovirus-related Pol polyprotein from transposon 17.6 [Trichonephila clavipes]
MAGGNLRLLHVNKIREYRARVQTVGVIYDIDDEFGEIYETPTVPASEKNDEALDRNEEETTKPKTYKIPENLKRKVDVQIDELLELGLIEPVVSEIAHPVVCVHKKDGTIRLCIDFRSLNALTVPNAYPMQNMMEMNFLVGKKKFITVLDMLKGYWSMPIEYSSKHLTAFRTHRG